MSGRGSSPHPGRASILRAPSARCPRWNTDRPRGGAPVAVSSRGPGPSASGPGNPGLAPSRLGDAPRSGAGFPRHRGGSRPPCRCPGVARDPPGETQGSRATPGHRHGGREPPRCRGEPATDRGASRGRDGARPGFPGADAEGPGPRDETATGAPPRGRSVFHRGHRAEGARRIDARPGCGDNLVQTYTFESFIVGESNRFAHGAAVAVAKQPAKEYNPLLITSGPGLGKTHLLHAIGNYILAHANESKVLYMTCEAFASSLANAKEVGTLSAFRDRIRGMDCLMIDDIQFLSGMPEIHEELFHTFNDLHDKEKQLVLASDRPPKAIPNLDDRLVSRFESGLVAGIEPPDLLMRVTILEHRARDENVSIEGEVLTCIANLVDNNVRELGGAFNRVVAFSSLMNRPITQDLAREVLSGATAEPSAEPIASPVSERIAPEERAARAPVSPTVNHELTPGRSYLIEEERPAKAFRLLTDFLGGGGGGLVISRTNPKRVRQAHD